VTPRTPVPHSSADRVTVGSDELTFRATSDATAGALVAIDVRMTPGGGPPLVHRHDAVEIYKVERGELAIYLEDDAGEVARVVAGAGSVVAIPGGREHTIRNESEIRARAYVVFAPGSEIEHFVRAADELAAQGTAEPADVLNLAERHGIEMTRPVPTGDPAKNAPGLSD
jgi:oxalate decarboxylase/phosphoglucose isomerase-like protein (cupin superfamily)